MILILLFLSDVRLGIVNLENTMHLKKISEGLMPIAWQPKRWWNVCIAEDEKKEIEPILLSNTFHVYNVIPKNCIILFSNETFFFVSREFW